MKKKSAVDRDGCVLPDDIVEDILSRLRAKTLMKLRIVCKKWKTLISTPYFKRLHIEKSLQYPNLLILPDSSARGNVLTTVSLAGDVLDKWNLPLRLVKDLEMLPFQWGPNNLVCFVVNWERIVVCNPSVRKIIKLPRQKSIVVTACGFCYLPSMNHYVIISGSLEKWQMITFSLSNNFKDLRTDGWRPIKNNTPSMMRGMSGGIFVNGVLYWTGLAPGWNHRLVCFDLYEEKFFDVAYSDEMKGSFHSLHNLNGDLHLLTRLDGKPRTLWKLGDVRNRTWIRQYTIEDGETLIFRDEFLEWYILQDEVFRMRRNDDESLGRFPYMNRMKLLMDTL